MTLRRTALALGVAAALAATGAPAQEAAPTPGLSPEGSDLFREVFSLVLQEYVDPKSPQEVVRGALKGAAESAGPECAYIPPEEAGAWRAAQTPSAGLPLYVSKGQDFARVLAVWPGVDARVVPGDSLRFIAGKSTYDMTYPEVVRALRGGAGETVSCIFLKPDTWEMYTVLLKRVAPPAPTLKRFQGGGAALRLPALEAAPSDELKAALAAEKGPLLVDLRGCASGDTAGALRWAKWLGGPAATATLVQKGVPSEVEGPGAASGARVARVLLSDTTARGGEVLASALAKAGAVLVGAKSFGWAPRFEELPLTGGGLLRLSTAYFATPSGEAMRDKPLEPSLPLTPKPDEVPEAFLLRALREPLPAPAQEQAPRGADGR